MLFCMACVKKSVKMNSQNNIHKLLMCEDINLLHKHIVPSILHVFMPSGVFLMK